MCMVIKVSRICFPLICMGIFLLPSTIRIGLFNSQWALINVISWMGIFLLLIYQRRKNKGVIFERRYSTIKQLWLPVVMGIFILFALIMQQFSFKSIVRYVYATLLPCVLLYVSVQDEDAVSYFKIFTKWLTGACTFIVLCGLLDKFFHIGFGQLFTNVSGSESLEISLRQGRLVSYYGHPLLTAELMLLCFLFNSINGLYLKSKEPIWYTMYYSFLSLIGIALTGSKTGIALLAIAVVFMYTTSKKWKYMICIIVGVYWIYNMGFLDTVIYRFIQGVQKGDMTTGRNVAFTTLLQTGILDFKMFQGHSGQDMSTMLIAAIEYPPLRWAYLFGGWFSIVMCTVLFFIPLIKCSQFRNLKFFMAMLLFIVDVNSYNGITTQSDHMLIYCVVMFLLMNISRVLKGRNV